MRRGAVPAAQRFLLAPWRRHRQVSHSLGNAGIARSKAKSTATAARGSVAFFSLEFSFLGLEIARQHGRIASKTSDAAISVLKHDEMELPAASGDLSGDRANSHEQSQLLQQIWRDSSADVTDYDGLPGLIPSI
jgi:hypothetical protein